MPEIEDIAVIPGARVIHLTARGDQRGRFLETWRREWIPGAPEMVQGNRSTSAPGVIRAFHYHRRQTDYWYMGDAHVMVALVDLRARVGGLATWARTVGPGEDVGLYIPPGVAHGFCALGESSLSYLVDVYYDGSDEWGIAWDDPEVGVAWPVREPILSQRDQANPRWRDVPAVQRP